MNKITKRKLNGMWRRHRKWLYLILIVILTLFGLCALAENSYGYALFYAGASVVINVILGDDIRSRT